MHRASISSGDLSAQFSSAVTAFVLVNSTRFQLLDLQNGGPASTFLAYVQSTMGKEMNFPYSISVYALETYTSAAIPNVNIFSYASNGFSNSVSTQTFYEPVVVTNSTSLCGTACNFSLNVQSGFPGQNVTVDAPNCEAYTNSFYPTGWVVYNNTPAGECTILIGGYLVNGLPNNYLIKAYSSGGGADGQATLYVLGLDTVVIKVQ